MKFLLVTILVAFVSTQIFAQCLVEKTGHHYGFFRVTNFKEKTCWLSEPFAYDVVNGEIANYAQIKACFIRKVSALQGNIEHDVDEFRQERVVWLNNTYDPKDELEASYNWNLPSAKACMKYIVNEVSYKTASGIKVNVVKMYSNGLIDNYELRQ